MKLAEKVKEFFHNEGIHSTTIQPEFVEIGPVSTLVFARKRTNGIRITLTLKTKGFFRFNCFDSEIP